MMYVMWGYEMESTPWDVNIYLAKYISYCDAKENKAPPLILNS